MILSSGPSCLAGRWTVCATRATKNPRQHACCTRVRVDVEAGRRSGSGVDALAEYVRLGEHHVVDRRRAAGAESTGRDHRLRSWAGFVSDARMGIVSTSPDSADQPTPPRGEPDTAAPTPDAVIRIPATAYVAAASIGVILLLPAIAWPAYWGWLPLVAVAVALWIHRRRTVVSPAGLQVRGLVGTRTVPWDAVRGVVVPTPRIFGKSWARAVLTDD